MTESNNNLRIESQKRKILLQIEIRVWQDPKYTYENIPSSEAAQSIKLFCNFIEITVGHGCSPVNLLLFSEHLCIRTPMESCFWVFILKIANIDIFGHTYLFAARQYHYWHIREINTNQRVVNISNIKKN